MSVTENDPILAPLEQLRRTMQTESLPAEDRDLSPYTGLTRDHWVAIADDMLLSVARFATPGGSRFLLPGRTSQQGVGTDGLEAFARTFLLAAYVTADGRGRDPHAHLDRYVTGVRAGTASWGSADGVPADPEAWPAIGHIGREGQTHVEAACIALSLHLSRERTWDLLGAAEQDRAAGWLASGLDKEPSSNNWYLFPFTIASFLEAVGRGDEQTAHVIERGLALVEQWYRGEGWYSDGDGEAFDHYVGWAMHMYPLLHSWLRQDTATLDRLSPRLHEFLETFARTFDRNGAPIYLGRSLTYRMGTLAAIALGEVIGATPWQPGQSRRLMSADLRYFLERGARVDGILNLGWHGPHAATTQRYSGPGSPYWASKGFAALLLGPEHPVWSAREEALPADHTDDVRALPSAGLMIQATAVDGLVRVHNHGSDHIKPHQPDDGLPDPLYARFSYTTRTGPTAVHNVADNDVQVQVRGVWSVRRRIHHVAAGADWVASWHAPRFPIPAPFDASDSSAGGPVLPSARIESVTLAHGSVEVRVHRVRGVPPHSPVRLGGYAVAAAGPEEIHVDETAGGIRVSAGELSSAVRPLYGLTTAAPQPAPEGTSYGPWAVVPELRGAQSAGSLPTATFVAAVQISADPDAANALSALVAHVNRGRVQVTWADGVEASVDLDALDWPTRW